MTAAKYRPLFAAMPVDACVKCKQNVDAAQLDKRFSFCDPCFAQLFEQKAYHRLKHARNGRLVIVRHSKSADEIARYLVEQLRAPFEFIDGPSLTGLGDNDFLVLPYTGTEISEQILLEITSGQLQSDKSLTFLAQTGKLILLFKDFTECEMQKYNTVKYARSFETHTNLDEGPLDKRVRTFVKSMEELYPSFNGLTSKFLEYL